LLDYQSHQSLVMSRDKKGRFLKGQSYSPETQFKKGEHWREEKPFWSRDWLEDEYVDNKKSAQDIGDMFGISAAAIMFWLRKHGIPRRDAVDARNLKPRGVSGDKNPMWGRTGELSVRWQGGITPDRQAFYVSQEWKTACSVVWVRDKATCQKCSKVRGEVEGLQFHVHHIVSFKEESLRSEVTNLVLLCKPCHNFVHSRENVNNEFIQKI
jgi:hypothetical protein